LSAFPTCFKLLPECWAADTTAAVIARADRIIENCMLSSPRKFWTAKFYYYNEETCNSKSYTLKLAILEAAGCFELLKELQKEKIKLPNPTAV